MGVMAKSGKRWADEGSSLRGPPSRCSRSRRIGPRGDATVIVRGGAVVGVVVRCLVAGGVPGSSGMVGSESSDCDVDGRGYSMLVEWSGTFETGFAEGRRAGVERRWVHRSLDSARFRSKWVPSVYPSYVVDGGSENPLS